MVDVNARNDATDEDRVTGAGADSGDDDVDLFQEIELELSREAAQDVTILLDEGEILPGLSGYYEVLYDEERIGQDRTSLLLYFPLGEELHDVKIELLMASLGIQDYEIRKKSVSRRAYLEAYKKYYTAFPVSKRIVIIPSWEKGTERERPGLEEGKLPLYLDPGLAFGTGQHPTTRLCLEYLDEHVTPGMRIIDAGCGSGILGIGALRLGAGYVFAFDVDGNAVTAVRQNLQLNDRMAGRMDVVQGGFELPSFVECEADLLLANITQKIIFANEKRIREGRYPRMVLSGILSEGRDDVVARFADGWRLLGESELEGWIRLEFERERP